MKKWNNEPAWGEPIVGFSNGADPLYNFYKEDIGAFYRSPSEFLEKKYPNSAFKADQITMISWILPQTEAISDGPFVGWNVPLRALSLFWVFPAFFLVTAVAEVFIRKQLPSSVETVSEVQMMGGVFHSKMRTVNNTLFEAALGLSAFSLTDLPVTAAADLIQPLAYFSFLFFLIVGFWVKLYRVYVAIPVWDEWLDFLTSWAPLLAIFAPPTFLPIFIATFALANAAVYIYAARFGKSDVEIRQERRSEFRRWAAGSLGLAILISPSPRENIASSPMDG